MFVWMCVEFENIKTYRRCESGEKNAFGTDGCFWHLKGGAVLNSCTIGFECFSSGSSFGGFVYMKHGIVWKKINERTIEFEKMNERWRLRNLRGNKIERCKKLGRKAEEKLTDIENERRKQNAKF